MELHIEKGNRLLLATVLNLIITVAEIIGGILSNSLALLSDALHNFSDTFATLFAYVADIVGKKGKNEQKTFGYQRIEIIAAFLNAAILIGICVYLIFEAWKKFYNPEHINSRIMFIVAVIGLVANFLSMLFLHRHAHSSLNVKAAYLHLLGDTFSSVGVVIASILLYFFNWYLIDPLLTLLISIYILKETYVVLKQAFNILMQSTPSELDLQKIKDSIVKEFESIDNLHHIHAWNLTENKIYFECHADLKNDINISETHMLNEKIKQFLSEKYNISHITIQFEYGCCKKH
jgi:cobalt-zinc-cadmium efflux system protein